ncbi:ABC transporter permease [Robertmurraya sp. DFI.2.37]|uniref:ABC transporter permease n=1 Tax=Robertmurraya sp. DFI.2.37 TaxID=3031819 RepID=UPI001246A06D|nr:ABC transporter permease [Robertmurraya sp. DFI.2.37]MDF1506968.1 ABC transporter permease [Robertmurraya sp. DFI.2.37]
MLNLLTAERIKLIRSKKLLIVLSILSILPIIQAVNSKMMVGYGTELIQAKDTVINGATGILMMEKNGLTVLLTMCAFIGFFIGEEFQNGTIRNALSLGRSRIHYYLSKLLMVSLLAFVGVVVLTALGMICFSIVLGFGEVSEINNYGWYALKTFMTLYLLILANVSIYVMISFITKNSAISLVWSFLYTIGTGFGAGIFLETEHFKHVTFWFTESFLFYSDFASPIDVAKYSDMILVSFITIVLSSIIGILVFKRADIK